MIGLGCEVNQLDGLVDGLPAETAAALRAITYGPMISAAFLTDEEGPQRWDGIYAIATPERRFSMLFNMGNVLMPQRVRGSSFMTYATASLARSIAGDADELLALERRANELRTRLAKGESALGRRR